MNIEELSAAKNAVVDAQAKVTKLLAAALVEAVAQNYGTFVLTDKCEGHRFKNASLVLERPGQCYGKGRIVYGHVTAEFYLRDVQDICIDLSYGPEYRPMIIEVERFDLYIHEFKEN